MKLHRTGCVVLILPAALLFSTAPLNASYQEEATAMKQGFAKKIDPAKADAYQRGIDTLAESGILEDAVQKGDKAPDFTLMDVTGEKFTLSELLTKGPVVLVWYRGGWCPYCNVHLRTLQKSLDAFAETGAQLVAISPEQPNKTLTTAQKNALSFPVLSDPGNRVAAEYGIVFTLPDYVAERYSEFFDIEEYNGDKSQTLPLSASYVIDKDGTVTYAFLDADYKNRAEPAVLLQEAGKLIH